MNPEFRRTERYEPAADTVRCYHCGKDCSGDTTENVDGNEVYVCDPTKDGASCDASR